MKTINNFLKEVKTFSINNWWVYIIYILLLIVIIYTKSGNLKVIILTTFLHFVADIFIMMMFSAYARKEYSEGSWFQFTSMLIFLSIKIFTGIVGGGWQYLTADLIYILAAIKNWRLDVKKFDIKIINGITMSLLSFVIILGVLTPLKIQGYILTSTAQWIQTIGIFTFAIALSTTNNERLRYLLSIIALTAMVVGSAWETANSITGTTGSKLSGLSLSYTLLPLTVLIFYIKKWRLIMS